MKRDKPEPGGLAGRRPRDSELEIRLGYHAPFQWRAMLSFLAARAIGGVERVTEQGYERTVSFGRAKGWLRLVFDRQRLEVKLSVAPTLSSHLQPIRARVGHLLDLETRSGIIDEVLARDPRLAVLVRESPGLRVPGAYDGFELGWRAILGQQVSVAGASTLASRLAARFGETIETPWKDLRLLTPTAEALAGETARSIAAIGIPLARATSILALARLHQEDPGLLGGASTPESARRRLTLLPGVGPWTVEYLLMRALHEPDAFPDTDLGLRRAAARLGMDDLREAADRWRPWRAYAAMRLWSTL